MHKNAGGAAADGLTGGKSTKGMGIFIYLSHSALAFFAGIGYTIGSFHEIVSAFFPGKQTLNRVLLPVGAGCFRG